MPDGMSHISVDDAALAAMYPALHGVDDLCTMPEDDPVSLAEADNWPELMARVRDRECRASFAEIFRHFAPRVKAYLIKTGSSDATAEECTQDVMTTIWRKAGQFDPARASVSTWVFTIARNRRIDIYRRRRPVPEELPWGPEPEPDQAETLSLQQESETLGRAIEALPEKQRDLIRRAYFSDLSHSEIAEATGLPLGTIKSRIRLALDRLRHAMDNTR